LKPDGLVTPENVPATRIADAIRAIVGDRGILAGDDVRMRSCDPFRQVPALSHWLVRPETTDELSRVMKLCSDADQPVVVHGGRTGVSGGAYTSENDIVISLERMNRIEEICPVTNLAVVGAGVTVEQLQQAAADKDMFYPVDLGSKGTATIGGTIATNAGGNRVLRWGMTRQNISGIEAVLTDGTVVNAMNRLLKNNSGYDIKHFFVGSEGTLGIVTRAVMRLVPMPTSHCAAFVATPDRERLLDLLQSARRLSTLSAFEVMWPDYYEIMVRSGTGRDPLELGQYAYILIEALGYSPEFDTEVFQEFLENAYEARLVTDAVIAKSNKEIDDLWRVREGAEILVQDMGSFVSTDISVDVRMVDAFVEQLRNALKEVYGEVRTATFGHLGDNNIHIALHIGPATLAEESNIERILFGIVSEFDGSITAEHGIGQLKREFMPDHKHPGEMRVMRDVRRALAPGHQINPNVLF